MTFEEADAAYPFDEESERDPQHLVGLAKMRAFREPGIRRNVYLVHVGDEERARYARPEATPEAVAEQEETERRYR